MGRLNNNRLVIQEAQTMRRKYGDLVMVIKRTTWHSWIHFVLGVMSEFGGKMRNKLERKKKCFKLESLTGIF